MSTDEAAAPAPAADRPAGGEPGPFHIRVHAAADPDKPAVVMADTGKTVTYAELERRSCRLAQLFARAGCGVGDHVVLLLENQVRFPEVCWAAQRSGLYYTAVNHRLAPAEMAYIVDECGATVLVTSFAQREAAAALRQRCTGVTTWLMVDGVIDGFEPYEEAVARHPAVPLDEELEGSAMLFSSGTTGRPKGVKKPLNGRPAGSTLYGFEPAVAATYGYTADSVVLLPTPLYHVMGLSRIVMCLGVGGTIVVLPTFDAEAALAAVERYRVTNSPWVPTMFVRLLRLPPEVRQRYDVSSLRSASLASAPCPPWAMEGIIDWWGPIVTEVYGGTEGMGATSITSEEWLAHRGSVGRPVLGEVHILRPDGTEAATGETGVIYFARGRDFEYFNDPVKTARSRSPQGWTTFGDMGHVDADGYLYITDRQVDMIISGGVNIYPREVEEVLLTHPAVDDVAVLGVPDDEWGESVRAVVRPRDGVVADAQLAAELVEHCRARIAHFKCPRAVDFVDEFPRNDLGKLLKRVLRDRYWEGRATRVR